MDLIISSFEKLLPLICTKETSVDPERWVAENPLWGHCAVVSLLANDLFGGTFLRADLSNTPFADVGSHYWNVFPNGSEYDFTRTQFGNIKLELIGKAIKNDGQQINREYLLKNTETKRRYNLLCSNLESLIKNT